MKKNTKLHTMLLSSHETTLLSSHTMTQFYTDELAIVWKVRGNNICKTLFPVYTKLYQIDNNQTKAKSISIGTNGNFSNIYLEIDEENKSIHNKFVELKLGITHNSFGHYFSTFHKTVDHRPFVDFFVKKNIITRDFSKYILNIVESQRNQKTAKNWIPLTLNFSPDFLPALPVFLNAPPIRNYLNVTPWGLKVFRGGTSKNTNWMWHSMKGIIWLWVA